MSHKTYNLCLHHTYNMCDLLTTGGKNLREDRTDKKSQCRYCMQVQYNHHRKHHQQVTFFVMCGHVPIPQVGTVDSFRKHVLGDVSPNLSNLSSFPRTGTKVGKNMMSSMVSRSMIKTKHQAAVGIFKKTCVLISKQHIIDTGKRHDQVVGENCLGMHHLRSKTSTQLQHQSRQ